MQDIKMLLFLSDGKSTTKGWISISEEFAKENNAEVSYLDCGHYVHHFESTKIAQQIKEFLRSNYGKKTLV